MKTINTADATGAALDWLVASIVHPKDTGVLEPSMHMVGDYAFTTDWAQGGPIIEREKIAISPYGYMDEAWRATTLKPEKHFTAYGDTALIAAMRCFCCSKLGDIVEVPEELCQQQSS